MIKNSLLISKKLLLYNASLKKTEFFAKARLNQAQNIQYRDNEIVNTLLNT